MGRAPCCDKANVKRGPWSPEEDTTLKNYLESYGTGGNWIALPQKAGLRRCGKSCRLRWLNYLRPDIKHGGFTEEEDNIICSLYITIGSRWSVIAAKLPGRTDNDVKNYWNTKLKKKFLAGKISSSSVPSPPSQHHHHHQPTSTTQSLKLENHGFSNSHLNQLNSSAAATALPMNTNFRQNSNLPRLVSDPIHHQFSISLPSPANASSSAASSYHQEVISAGVSPSVLQPASLTFENNYSFWSGNGGGINGTDHQDGDGFFMDFGFNPSSYDFLYDLGFQYQEKSSTSHETVVASNSANTSSTLLYANLLGTNSTTTTTDTKSQQGFYQSVRN